MPAVHKLKAQQLLGLPDGMHGDGANLYLRVRDEGKSRNFVFIYRFGGKQKLLGLGAADPYGRVGLTLADARQKADNFRARLRDGQDPGHDLREQKSVAGRALDGPPTFAEFVDKYLTDKEKGWKNEKHRAQWRMTLKIYAAPLANIPVNLITTDHVLECLNPIWIEKPETARRTRGRIENVLDAARVKGHIPKDAANPARFAGHLKLLLPDVKKSSKHHAALPYGELPAFMNELRKREALSARALEFLILTTARTEEVLNFRWNEVNFDSQTWIVPPGRMKKERGHDVPLSPRAIAILRDVAPLAAFENAHVFPGSRRDRGLSNMAFEALLRRMGKDAITTHGFRSTFRDWAGDETDAAREVAEAALSHIVGDKAEQAYRRGTAFQKRRKLMNDWADYCCSAFEIQPNTVSNEARAS